MFDRARPRRLLLVGVLVAAVLRLWGAASLPLSGDEAYHWEWSRHLAGAYYDHPGMTAWLIALSTWLLPQHDEVAVRMPALVSLLLATALTFGFARDLARTRGADHATAERAGTLAGALTFFVPLPAGLSAYMSTDPPLMPLWLGAVWALFAAIERGRLASWLLCGACIGLAASTKLISLQLVGVVGVVLLFTRDGRGWLSRPHPWLALAVAAVAALPMVWWNATNDWMTFRFNFDIRQREQPASFWHPVVFLAGQAAILTPGFMLLGLGACVARAGRAKTSTTVAVCCAVLPLAFFFLVSLRRSVGVHWTAAPWLVAFVFLAVAIAMADAWTLSRLPRFLWRSSWVMTAIVLVVAQMFLGIGEEVARWDIAGGQPRAVLRNLFGWPEAGQAAGIAAEQLRARPGSRGVFLISNQYGTTAALSFYTPGRPRAHLWSAVRNHGRNYGYWDDWSSLAGLDAVYVVKRELAEWELPLLRSHFAEVGAIERLPIMRRGEERNAFYLVRCQAFDGRPPFP